MNQADISWINNRLATGGDFSFREDVRDDQIEDLLSQGIRLVIDCREEEDDRDLWSWLYENRGEDIPEYVHLPTDDRDGHVIPPAHFDAAVGAAMPYIERGEKVFIHCHMGVNRGPSTAYAVMLEMGYDALDAFDLIRSKRPQAAIYYARDALVAYLRRHHVGVKVRQETLRALDRHIQAVMTDEDIRAIQHHIRKGHAQDERELRG